MNTFNSLFRLGILFLALCCSMGATGQTEDVIRSNDQPISLQSTNEGDSISKIVESFCNFDESIKVDSTIYEVVEEPPSFPGGQTALMSWLAENIHCPSTCKSISGRVLLSFIVETDGTLSNIQIVRKLDTEFDEEFIRAVKAMPKWIPGKQNGQTVRVKYNMPLTICMQ